MSGVWQVENVLDDQDEPESATQYEPQTLNIEVVDVPGVLNEITGTWLSLPPSLMPVSQPRHMFFSNAAQVLMCSGWKLLYDSCKSILLQYNLIVLKGYMPLSFLIHTKDWGLLGKKYWKPYMHKAGAQATKRPFRDVVWCSFSDTWFTQDMCPPGLEHNSRHADPMLAWKQL